MKPEDIISSLELLPLAVEGGYFREIYRSERNAATNPPRCLGTSIYYFLRGHENSAWHLVKSDEIWFYHAGCSAIQLLLFPDGSWEERRIGADIEHRETPQSVIPAGVWQAAVLSKRNADVWGLFGACVFPGFEYEDFVPGDAAQLSIQYPSAAVRMRELGLA
ncbi:MAG: hypothetical protein A2X49_06465 [Lentisphaerae bacterium GWF2_52_8]|nr:MAG: hypothetical protein A2X49_06465 [Lentisphaerae bacterium GWF2_52_8]